MDNDLPTKVLETKIPPHIGHYQVEAEIGRGGMGVVYKVKSSSGEIFALKILSPQEGVASDAWKRFQREVELLKTVDHPNITKIYDVGEWQNRPYFVMDLLEGVTLSKYVREKKQLPEKEALQIIWKITRALVAVHKMEILHRDIKPSNIFLCKKKPYLMDFGIGCAYTSDTRITRAGTILGTANYMPPEQARGEYEKMGPWSDVYAVGTTLYHILSGIIPFKGKSDLEVIINVQEKELRPVSKYNSAVSAETDFIIEKATQKRPKDRYQTMQELADDLYAALHEQKGVIKIPRKHPQQSTWLGNFMLISSGVLCLLILGAVVVWKLALPDDKPREGKIVSIKLPDEKLKPEHKPTESHPDNTAESQHKKSSEPNDTREETVAQTPANFIRNLTFPKDEFLMLLAASVPDNEKIWRTALQVELNKRNAQKVFTFLPQLLQYYWDGNLYSHAQYYLEEAITRFPHKFMLDKSLQAWQTKLQARSALPAHLPPFRRKIWKMLTFLAYTKIALDAGNMQKSNLYLDKAIQEADDGSMPDMMPFLHGLRVMSYLQKNDIAQARAEAKKMLAPVAGPPFYPILSCIHAQNHSHNLWPETVFVQGVLEFAVHDYPQALKQFTRIEQLPAYPSGDKELASLAAVYVKGIHESEEKRKELGNNIPAQMISLIDILAVRGFMNVHTFNARGELQKSVDVLEDLFHLESRAHMCHYQLGNCYLLRAPAKNTQPIWQQAIQHFSLARYLSPGFNDPIFYLGKIAWSTGYIPEATRYFRHCQKCQPRWLPGYAEVIEDFFKK